MMKLAAFFLALFFIGTYAGYAVTSTSSNPSTCTTVSTIFSLRYLSENFCYPWATQPYTLTYLGSNNTFRVDKYNDTTCSGKLASTSTKVQTCSNGVLSYTYSATPYPPTITNALVTSTYASCKNRTILGRYYNIPNTCVLVTSTYSYKYLPCNSTHLPIRSYNSSDCSGGYTDAVSDIDPQCVTDNGFGVVDSECYIADTTSTSTTGGKTTVSSSNATTTTTTGGSLTSGAVIVTTGSPFTPSDTATGTTGTAAATATIKISLEISVTNASAVNTSAMASGFADALGLDPSQVSVEIRAKNTTKRATVYEVIVTIITPVTASSSSSSISTYATNAVSAAISDSSSPLAASLSKAGATVTQAPTATVTVVSSTTSSSPGTSSTSASPSSPTTTGQSDGSQLKVGIALLVILFAFICL